jgi:hypothetical protein
MSTSNLRASQIVGMIEQRFTPEEYRARQSPKPATPLPPSIRPTRTPNRDALDAYWQIMTTHGPGDDSAKQAIAGAAGTTRFGKLIEIRPHVEGNHIYVGFIYTTGATPPGRT